MWGCWGGFFFGGIILGIPALVSYNRWKRGETDRPLIAEVIGWVVVAILVFAFGYGIATA